jgi:PKHD-type hydroxylase
MIFTIPDLLLPEELLALRQQLSQLTFVDGEVSAGWYAKLVKHNHQLPAQAPTTQALVKQIVQKLSNSDLFQTATRPRRIHSLLFSRYDVGMSYGPHIDNALIGGFRADVSFTLFLSDVDSYDGGELVIEGADDEKAYKLPAGSALVYPTTSLHRVNPVTAGCRLVVVGWVQSLVRNAYHREILFDLDTVRRSLFKQAGKTLEFDLLSKTLSNLLRQWAE